MHCVLLYCGSVSDHLVVLLFINSLTDRLILECNSDKKPSSRGQSGLEAKVASRPKFWHRPRPQRFGLDLASISLSYYVIGHFSGKNLVKFGNFVNFSGNNLKSYVVSHDLALFIIIFGLGLGLNLQKLASASASRFWSR